MVKLLALCALAACQTSHEVHLLLGPDENSLSIGFECRDPGTGRPLFEAARQGDGMYHFQVVVDFVPVGDHVPGCRGEDIARTCAGTCSPQLTARYCKSLVVGGATADELVANIKAALHADPEILANTPDGTVIIRAVTTLQTCAQLGPTLSGSAAIGCAYSCPVELDHVSTVSLYLDAFTTDCGALVAACAAFPASP